jgi:hypothetical protein
MSNKRRRRERGECGVCTFWELTEGKSADGYQDEGICRYHAPSPIPSKDISSSGLSAIGDVGLYVAWPITFRESDWCSKFVARDQLGGRDLEDAPEDKP